MPNINQHFQLPEWARLFISLGWCQNTIPWRYFTLQYVLDILPIKKKKITSTFFFVNSYQYNLRNEWLRSKEKIETEPFVTVCTSKYSGLDNVWAGEYISLYPLVTHSAMKCSNTIWMDTLWRVDCKKPCPYWHNIEDKLLGSTSRISYTHMSTVMEFAINIFGFLPT